MQSQRMKQEFADVIFAVDVISAAMRYDLLFCCIFKLHKASQVLLYCMCVIKMWKGEQEEGESYCIRVWEKAEK